MRSRFSPGHGPKSRFLHGLLAALALVALAAGCGGGGSLGECPPNSQNQQDSGAMLVFVTCVGCHSSELEGADRLGAPEGLDFDQIEIIRAEADSMFDTVVDGSMPPGGANFNDTQVEAFRVFLACESQQ